MSKACLCCILLSKGRQRQARASSQRRCGSKSCRADMYTCVRWRITDRCMGTEPLCGEGMTSTHGDMSSQNVSRRWVLVHLCVTRLLRICSTFSLPNLSRAKHSPSTLQHRVAAVLLHSASYTRLHR